jgi:hypothetical protein
MEAQIVLSAECFVTAITKERLESAVSTLMSVQITALVERFVAILTHEWLLAVQSLPCLQLTYSL